MRTLSEYLQYIRARGKRHFLPDEARKALSISKGALKTSIHRLVKNIGMNAYLTPK